MPAVSEAFSDAPSGARNALVSRAPVAPFALVPLRLTVGVARAVVSAAVAQLAPTAANRVVAVAVCRRASWLAL